MNAAPYPSRPGRWRTWLLRGAVVGAIAAAGIWFPYEIARDYGIPWFRSRRYVELLRATGAQYNVPPALLYAVIWQESHFDPLRRGRAGEIGLMQVTLPAAQEWARAEKKFPIAADCLWAPETNLAAGAWYLSRALKRWSDRDDPLPFALAEYNAGRSNVIRWSTGLGGQTAAGFRKAVTYPSTRKYITEIQLRYERGW